jgi:hypothetical protein
MRLALFDTVNAICDPAQDRARFWSRLLSRQRRRDTDRSENARTPCPGSTFTRPLRNRKTVRPLACDCRLHHQRLDPHLRLARSARAVKAGKPDGTRTESKLHGLRRLLSAQTDCLQGLPEVYRIKNGLCLPCAGNAFIIKGLPHFTARKNDRRRKPGLERQPGTQRRRDADRIEKSRRPLNLDRTFTESKSFGLRIEPWPSSSTACCTFRRLKRQGSVKVTKHPTPTGPRRNRKAASAPA